MRNKKKSLADTSPDFFSPPEMNDESDSDFTAEEISNLIDQMIELFKEDNNG